MQFQPIKVLQFKTTGVSPIIWLLVSIIWFNPILGECFAVDHMIHNWLVGIIIPIDECLSGVETTNQINRLSIDYPYINHRLSIDYP